MFDDGIYLPTAAHILVDLKPGRNVAFKAKAEVEGAAVRTVEGTFTNTTFMPDYYLTEGRTDIGMIKVEFRTEEVMERVGGENQRNPSWGRARWW